MILGGRIALMPHVAIRILGVPGFPTHIRPCSEGDCEIFNKEHGEGAVRLSTSRCGFMLAQMLPPTASDAVQRCLEERGAFSSHEISIWRKWTERIAGYLQEGFLGLKGGQSRRRVRLASVQAGDQSYLFPGHGPSGVISRLHSLVGGSTHNTHRPYIGRAPYSGERIK